MIDAHHRRAVLNHRLIQAERSLRGAQLAPGDFFPTIFPFNPAPDMLTGVFRHLLGPLLTAR